MADEVVKTAESGKTPHVDVPTRSLSNVQVQQGEAIHRNGQRHQPPATVQSVAGQELHADDARGQRLQRN